MGQRLNVEIVDDGEVLANAYYHWSAYTSVAAEITDKVIDAYYHANALCGIPLAVEILQATGAGLNEEERLRVRNDTSGRFAGIKFCDSKSRNEGLISVTKEGIEETERWEEHRVTIDIFNETVSFDVNYWYTAEDYIDEYGKDEYDEIPLLEDEWFEIDFRFRDIGRFRELVACHPGEIRLPDGDVCAWIE